ncbi:hypothetical protein [Altererythrobacter sp. Root672]|uniref:hypothetical protein n=1 Tax=Altererythrobacter sp. Root672 TaxID=1736584 RepID=UPI0006FEF8AB|nr:hypothetical protein [Altererythrobacter sp. Root672]
MFKFKLARKVLAAASIGALSMAAATPAQAGYYVTYWSDYVGGTNVGGAFYGDGGNLCYSWGVQYGILFYQYAGPGGC